jgi:hypothetical protein
MEEPDGSVLQYLRFSEQVQDGLMTYYLTQKLQHRRFYSCIFMCQGVAIKMFPESNYFSGVASENTADIFG